MTLSDRIAALDGPSNELDLLYEIAMFQPDRHWKGCRANSAGTKVIYTPCYGPDRTFRACDWTLTPKSRAAAVAAMKARGL